MYDSGAPEIVEQNLGKEAFWAFINSTGALPSATITNTTYKFTKKFFALPNDGDHFETIYKMDYKRTFVTTETNPPYDMTLEIPANTRTFRTFRTQVDFQSCKEQYLFYGEKKDEFINCQLLFNLQF